MRRNPAPDYKPLIVGIGGTIRENSTSEKAARAVLRHAETVGAETIMFGGPDLIMPMYDPLAVERSDKATRLIEGLRQAAGIVISSPGYHGTISGLIKNALDYTEDMRGDMKVYLGGRAVACIGCASGWQAANTTVFTLRSIAHALRAWPTPLAATINTSETTFDENGVCLDGKTDSVLKIMAEQLVKLSRMRYLARAADPDWDLWVKTDETIPSLFP